MRKELDWPLKWGDISELRNILLKYFQVLVDWEILPAGSWEDWERSSRGKHGNGLNEKRKGLLEERENFLKSLPIRALIRGKVLGAKTEYKAVMVDGKVLADNPVWGNAIYICSASKWQEILPLPKGQAIKAGAQRFCHAGQWQKRAKIALSL